MDRLIKTGPEKTNGMRLFALLMSGLLAAGCAGAKPVSPFKVPHEEFDNRTRLIAIATVGLPSGLDDPEAIRSRFDSIIEAKLTEAGFSIVPAKEYENIWSGLVREAGGLFDPITGKPDQEKETVLRERTLEEIREQFKAEAVLYPVIGVQKIEFKNEWARWNGTAETLVYGRKDSDNSSFIRFLKMFAAPSSGTVTALSLGIFIEDMHRAQLYAKWGGIQLLAKLNRGKFVDVPVSELLNDSNRNTAAVDYALSDLVQPGERE